MYSYIGEKMKKIFLATVAVILITGCGESSEHEAMLFNAWMKTHPGFNINQKEWQILREGFLLPGQSKLQDDNGDIALGTMIGVTTGIAVGAGRR
jgi:hypothetical protein